MVFGAFLHSIGDSAGVITQNHVFGEKVDKLPVLPCAGDNMLQGSVPYEETEMHT